MSDKLIPFDQFSRSKTALPSARNNLQISEAQKTGVYEALYRLNCVIQEVLVAVDSLDCAGLGLPFLNGYRILGDQIRRSINFSATEVMTAIELWDYDALKKKSVNRISPIFNCRSPKIEVR